MSMFTWLRLAARRRVRRRSIHLRVNGTLYRFVDEESVEFVYTKDKEHEYLNADAGIMGEVSTMKLDSLLQDSTESVTAPATPSRLPKRAEKVVLLIFPKEIRDHLLGDLAEEYAEIVVKHGVRFANFWYWKQVTASAWPFLKKALWWGLLISTWKWARRLI